MFPVLPFPVSVFFFSLIPYLNVFFFSTSIRLILYQLRFNLQQPLTLVRKQIFTFLGHQSIQQFLLSNSLFQRASPCLVQIQVTAVSFPSSPHILVTVLSNVFVLQSCDQILQPCYFILAPCEISLTHDYSHCGKSLLCYQMMGKRVI
uniref:Uncharacterized protein n=1 Tax=Cacopsylla melanoneura TaxID=428564 RepID=A0A8D8RKC8_9HEMI